MTELGGVQDEDGKAVKGFYYTFRGEGLNLRYKAGQLGLQTFSTAPKAIHLRLRLSLSQ